MEQSLKNISEDASSIEGDSCKKEKSQTGAMLDVFSVSRRRKMVFAGNEKSRCRLDILVGFLTAAL